MVKCDLEVLSPRANCDRISGVMKVSTSKQDRRRNQINGIESDVTHMVGMFTSYVEKSVNVLPIMEISDNKNIPRDLKEIGGIAN